MTGLEFDESVRVAPNTVLTELSGEDVGISIDFVILSGLLCHQITLVLTPKLTSLSNREILKYVDFNK